MKKALSILLSLLLLTALLTACNTNTNNDDTSSTPPSSPSAPVSQSESPSPTPSTPETPAETPPAPVELYISAAASLTDVIEEIGAAYMAANEHVTLVYNFGSSGTLQTQIEEGAPADIFLSAAQKQMDALADKDLIDAATRLDLLINKVVLILPVDSDADITSFEDVTTDKVSMVAIGEASVPVGQYTEEIYTHLGTWDQVQAKANPGENVRAVLAWVETGDADCGIVYATDAYSTDLVKVVAEAPEGSHKPVVYPGAVLAETENADEAQAFLDFLSTPDAVKAFEAAGFSMA